ncbi:type II toxin-antitoxin system YafQ family toxin [Bathymodiolus platifrons methanotrophic gill symbiont]|uniref:type II toxin-antitoxin system YafQ family toxin n=1 Tax=Bathymodiolus platifrons methanotrophic gill symbiont TaxID=113268 RepID=UPI001E2AC1BD|nr:type II toxin-antitoxin system YafQ family toxin [Bathymodiolus platifrons methanotrophic gill symbiont]
MKNVRLKDTQITKLFLYVSMLLSNKPLPLESKDHCLHGEWSDFRELLWVEIHYLSIRPMNTLFT